MASPSEALRMSYAEYLALERTSETKHEYVNGEVWAMAGGTPEHARLASRFGALLDRGLGDRRCSVFSSDLRVRVPATGRSTYPDLSVVCEKLERADDDEDAITNPRVLVEILSDTTEASDRGDKWAHYQRLPSLREYVLVSQRTRRVEVFRRAGETWTYHQVSEAGTVELMSLDVAFTLEELYADPLSS